MTVTTAQTIALLENVLFESATLAQANAARWEQISASNSADSTTAGLASAMANSAEAGIAEQVVRYYQGALGRQPDATEIAYYVKIAESGLSASQIAQGPAGVPISAWNQFAGFFAASPEYQTLTAGGNLIPALYQNILGRAPSADEVGFYQKALEGGTPVSALLQYFVNSTEYQSKVNAGIASQLAQGYTSSTPIIVDPIAPSVSAGAVTVTAGTATAAVTVAATAVSVTPNWGNLIPLAGVTGSVATGVDIVVDTKISTITLNNETSAVTLDFSHLSGTSAVTASLPSGSETFSYDGVTVHIVNSAQAVQLVGVSASQITLLPTHS